MTRKSQLALEYAYRAWGQSTDVWVLWIYAGSQDCFAQEVAKVVGQIMPPGQGTSPDEHVGSLRNWLRHDSRRAWLLIIDSLDDVENAMARRLIADLSSCTHGFVLITTRSKDVALEVVGRDECIVVEPMDADQATSLLRNKLRSTHPHEPEDDLCRLAAKLDNMPLALAQAAAYIAQRERRSSIKAYLKLLQDDDSAAIALEKSIMEESFRRHTDSSNAIYRTWWISFEHIKRASSSAANLLCLMSFFDCQNIPWTILQVDAQGDMHEDSTEMKLFVNDLEDNIVTLSSYKLISHHRKDDTFVMHGLVQRAIRRWLETNGELSDQQRDFIIRLEAAFPKDVSYSYWGRCGELFPHIMSSTNIQFKDIQSKEIWSDLAFRAAAYALRRKNTRAGNILANISRDLANETMGPNSELTLRREALLVRVALDFGRHLEVCERGKLLLETLQRTVGREDSHTLDLQHDLAMAYTITSRYDEAEKEHNNLYQTYLKLRGPENIDTLRSQSNIAILWSHKKQFADAANLHEKILEIKTRKFGKESPTTLDSMQNLATAYWHLGIVDRAEELTRIVFELREQRLGADDTGTLCSKESLAGILRHRGELLEAEDLATLVLSRRQITQGIDHPETLRAMNNLLLIQWQAGKDSEARTLSRECATLSSKVFGEQHPVTIRRSTFANYLARGSVVASWNGISDESDALTARLHDPDQTYSMAMLTASDPCDISQQHHTVANDERQNNLVKAQRSRIIDSEYESYMDGNRTK